jgi:hypothetical protein
MALSLINKVHINLNYQYHADYKQSMLDYQEKAKSLRLGYVPGVIRHHYHGTKANRKYVERWKILIEYQYSPLYHLTYDKVGILVPTESFSKQFKKDILNYFRERKEDE